MPVMKSHAFLFPLLFWRLRRNSAKSRATRHETGLEETHRLRGPSAAHRLGDKRHHGSKAVNALLLESRLEAIAIRSKKLLGAKGIATRSKDATRGSWPYY